MTKKTALFDFKFAFMFFFKEKGLHNEIGGAKQSPR